MFQSIVVLSKSSTYHIIWRNCDRSGRPLCPLHIFPSKINRFLMANSYSEHPRLAYGGLTKTGCIPFLRTIFNTDSNKTLLYAHNWPMNAKSTNAVLSRLFLTLIEGLDFLKQYGLLELCYRITVLCKPCCNWGMKKGRFTVLPFPCSQDGSIIQKGKRKYWTKTN